MSSFDLLIHGDAIEFLKKSRGENRRALRAFLDSLASDPYRKSDTNYTDEKGRVVSKIRIRTMVIDFTIDDPVREVKVLRIASLKRH